MGQIIELSAHVADLIAAGEVVERPASVMKELLENAIDAGASALTAEIENGGITYLRVTDDGKGIERDDVPTAFLRHATSKLKNEEDLASIHTLGFRGEALAAIASVSRVELFTRNAADEEGTLYRISGGKVTEHKEAGCPLGTTIVVRDLFYNTPARMKFLKKDMTEGGYVSEAVEHIALSKPGVSVKFIKDQKILFHTPGDGEPYSAIYCVYGADFAASLIPTALQIGSIDVSGFVSKPSASRGNRSMQAFFVNGRHVRSKLLQAALEGAYKNRLLTGRFPSCVLDVKVPFSTVDVNVHPAKTEIKFSEEKKVFEAVYAAVKSALDGFSDRPEIVLYTRDERRDMLSRKGEKLPDETPPVFVPSAQKPAEEPKAYEPKVITMPEQSGSFPLHDCKGAFYQPVQSIYQTAKTGDAVSAVTLKETAQGTKPEAEAPRREPPCETESVSEKLSDEVSFRMIGEAFGTYILVEDSDGLLIIDKHAAHERIIFDGLKKGDIELAPQLLLTPEVFSVGRLEASVIKEHLDDFLKLGFDIGEFGENSFIVRQVPPYIDSGDVTILLGELVKKIRDSERLGLDLLDELLHSVSCKAAVKAKSRMQPDELYEIAKRVVETPELQFCPHGRPVAVRLTSKQLEKQFFRIV